MVAERYYDDNNYHYQQLAYITNHCIKINNQIWSILECQHDFMTIHYFTDRYCKNEISECMKLWKSDTYNLVNGYFIDHIYHCYGFKQNEECKNKTLFFFFFFFFFTNS